MKYYTQIPIWENMNRVESLLKFRQMVIEYFNNLEHGSWLSSSVTEKERAKQLRPKINSVLDNVYQIIIAAGIRPVLYYSPPPAISGIAGDIDLFYNMFHLHRFEISPNELLDFIDRAIGKYNNDRRNSLLRTFNPFFWLNLLFEYIAGLPLKLIGMIIKSFGFDQSRLEKSIIGKTIKGIFYLITIFAAFLTVIEKLGMIENFKLFLKKLLNQF